MKRRLVVLFSFSELFILLISFLQKLKGIERAEPSSLWPVKKLGVSDRPRMLP